MIKEEKYTKHELRKKTITTEWI